MKQPPQPPYRNQPGTQPQAQRRSQAASTPRTEELGVPQAGGQTPRRSFFYSKPFLLALVLLVLVLGAFLVYQFTRQTGPATSWLTTETVGKQRILYYLHWNDDNGALRGSYESDLFVGGSLHTASWSFVATYNAQNSTLHIVFDKANAANIPFYTADATIDGNTLTMKKSTNSDAGNSPLVFHTASTRDYEQAKKSLA